ncbi:SPHINGOSINE KINASE [Ceraceosorus bombacis]|uniref:Mitochondrial import inner membrane translocase subunit TIM54 n=1 Tax=Ceraceosorus bombacis TaxID=401625 RepID=A0A0N7LB01_9BASI|nr:SPHINGOSINE KINASE [Ceraceosorus bombacis]
MVSAGNSGHPAPGSGATASASTSTSSPPIGAAVKSPAPPREIPPTLRPLQYLGIPRSVLTWQPKLPSRNWLIFIGTTSTLTALYVYDRRECKRIREEYKDKVRHLAEEPLKPNQFARKVKVYCAKSPGDDDYDKSLMFFKKFVKPILVAAAIDWDTTNGTRYGGLGRAVREDIYARRRQLLGLEAWGTSPSSPGASSSDPPSEAQLTASSPFALSAQDQLQRELEGATVIVGRPAYKEYMWGLKEGWTTSLPAARSDLDEPLAKRLAEDSVFDEVEYPEVVQAREKAERLRNAPPLSRDDEEWQQALAEAEGSAAVSGTAIQGGSSISGSSLSDAERNAAAALASLEDEGDGAGAPLPPRRHGGGAAGSVPFSMGPRSVVEGISSPAANARLAPPAQIPAQAPLVFFEGASSVQAYRESPPQGGDLDWGLRSEDFVLPRFEKTLTDVSKARESYYNDLPRQIRDTRTLARGLREPSAVEKNNPPKTEMQLREERMRREREWEWTEQGYEILRKDNGVAWHEAFRGSLRVFESPREEAKEEL